MTVYNVPKLLEEERAVIEAAVAYWSWKPYDEADLKELGRAGFAAVEALLEAAREP